MPFVETYETSVCIVTCWVSGYSKETTVFEPFDVPRIATSDLLG